MKSTPVLLLVVVAAIALVVEGKENVELTKQLVSAFRLYNRGPYREWFGSVNLNLDTMKGGGKLYRVHMFYRDGSFGIFSFTTGEQGGKHAVKLYYTYHKGGSVAFKKEKGILLRKLSPTKIYKLMRRYVKYIKRFERKRLGIDKKVEYFFVMRNTMTFNVRKVKGKFVLRVKNLISRNHYLKDVFNQYFKLVSGSTEEVAQFLAKYRMRVRERNIQQYQLLMKDIASSNVNVNAAGGNTGSSSTTSTTSGTSTGSGSGTSSTSTSTGTITGSGSSTSSTSTSTGTTTGSGSGTSSTSTGTSTGSGSSTDITSTSSTSNSTDVNKSFDFKTSLENGKFFLHASCVFKKYGVVLHTINKSYPFSDQDILTESIADFKNNVCKLPEPPRILN